MYDDEAIELTHIVNSAVDLYRAETYESVNKAFASAISDIRRMAESKFSALARAATNEAIADTHDKRVQAQGGI